MTQCFPVRGDRVSLSIGLSLLILVSNASTAGGQSQAIPSLEREALIAIYESNNGPEWRRKRGWIGPAGTESTWEGVTVEDGAVVELDLHGNNLTGVLTGKIGNLKRLRTLLLGPGFLSIADYPVNRLTGLEEGFGQLENLEVLDLRFNLIQALPVSFGSLRTLRDLDLGTNAFTQLPESFGDLASLAILRLGGNDLLSLPQSIGDLSQLRELSLERNALERLPESLGSLGGLERLILRDNKLTALPAAIGLLASLDYLGLADNQLTGLPTSIGSLGSLTYLNLDKNRLTEFPESIVMLAALENLEAAENRLATLPSVMDGWISLRFLDLRGNLLTRIPDSIGSLSRLETLNVSQNALTALPGRISDLSLLRELLASENKIQGTVPPEWERLESVEKIDLSNNQLTGGVPDEIFMLEKLLRLDLSHNELSGHLNPPRKAGRGRWYNFSHNQFSGEITPTLVRLRHSTLGLSHNQISGEIPPGLFFNRYKSVDLSHNRLTGAVPPALSGPGTWGIGLAGNRLSGAVPPSLRRPGDHFLLDLRWNALYAEDPAVAADLERVWNVTFSDTQTIAPREIRILQVDANRVELSWKGSQFVDTPGAYEILCSPAPGGPYSLCGVTPDKQTLSQVISGVDLNTVFVMRTVTEPHENNSNRVVSRLSPEVSLPGGALVAYEFLPVLPVGSSSIAALALSNPNTMGHRIRLEAFDRGGNSLAGPFSAMDLELGSGEQAAALFDQWLGTSARGQPVFARLSSPDEGPFGSSVFVGAPGRLEGAPVQTSPARSVHFTRVVQGVDVLQGHPASTVISIANPNRQPVVVELGLFNAVTEFSGGMTGTVEVERITRHIPGHGFLLESVSDLFPAQAPLNGYIEAAVVEGEGILGFEWISLSGESLVGLPAVASDVARNSWSIESTISSQLANNLHLINLGDSPRNVEMWLRSRALNKKLRTRLTLQPGWQFQGNLRQFLEADETQEPIELSLSFEGGDGLLADLILTEAGSMRFATALPLTDRTYRTAILGYVAQNHQVFTGLSLYNPSGSSGIDVTIDVYASDGSPLATSSHTLKNWGRLSGLLSELVPDVGILDRGSLVIRAAHPIVVQGIIGDYAGTFMASILPTIAGSADRGPIR